MAIESERKIKVFIILTVAKMLKKAKSNLIHFTIASIMVSTIVSTLPTKTIAQSPPETLPSPSFSGSQESKDPSNQQILGAILLILGGLMLGFSTFLISRHRSSILNSPESRASSNFSIPVPPPEILSYETEDDRSGFEPPDHSSERIELKQEIDMVKSQPIQLQINNTQSDDVKDDIPTPSDPEIPTIPQKLSKEELIQTYNANAENLASSIIGVSETKGSFDARRSSLQMPMIFELSKSKPRFWIYNIDNFSFLMPSPKSKITTPLLGTISSAFQHNEFSSSYALELIQPAIVAKMSDGSDRWQLLSKGEIKFITIPESVIEN